MCIPYGVMMFINANVCNGMEYNIYYAMQCNAVRFKRRENERISISKEACCLFLQLSRDSSNVTGEMNTTMHSKEG
jgi:hypothetical protein